MTLDEAVKKQMKIENDARRIECSIPKKAILANALMEQLAWEKAHPDDSKLKKLFTLSGLRVNNTMHHLIFLQ